MKVRNGTTPRELVAAWHVAGREIGWSDISTIVDFHIPAGYVIVTDSTTTPRKRSGHSNGQASTCSIVIFHANSAYPSVTPDALIALWSPVVAQEVTE